nr:hypothetical protein [Sphingobium sp.]
MKFLSLAIVPALALSAVPAFAHGDDKPRHGGQVVEVGETVFELVRAPAGASLYMIEDGDEVPASSMTGKLIVTVGSAKTEFPLVAAKGNQFVAKGAKIPAGARVGVLVVNRQTQARQAATFAIK